MGYAATGIIDVHHGYGHHTLTISAHDFKVRAPVSVFHLSRQTISDPVIIRMVTPITLYTRQLFPYRESH